jgi:intracellular multiplication protein IcmD
MSWKSKKFFILLSGAVASFALGTVALAAGSGIGSVAGQVITNLPALAKLITAGAYVAGMAFAVGAIVKFKAHKEAPTQHPLGTAVVFLFVGAALLFAPSVFKVSGATLFSGGQVGGISGKISF